MGAASTSFYGDWTNYGEVHTEDVTTFNKPGAVYTNYGDFTMRDSLTIFDGTVVQAAGTMTVGSSDTVFTLSESVWNVTDGTTYMSGTLGLSGSSAVNITGGTFLSLGTLNLSDSTSVNVSGGLLDLRRDMVGSSANAIHVLTGGTLRLTGLILPSPIYVVHDGGVVDNTVARITGNYTYISGTFMKVPELINATLSFGPGSTAPAEFILTHNNVLTFNDGYLRAGQKVNVRRDTTGMVGTTVPEGFTNEGTIELSELSVLSGITSFSVLSGKVVNNPTGLIHFQDESSWVGDLENYGTVQIDAPSTLDKPAGHYVNAGNFILNHSLSIKQGGTFDQIGGVIQSTSSLQVASGGTLNISGGQFNGPIAIWNGGHVFLSPGGLVDSVVNIEGDSGGRFTQTGGTINFKSGCTIEASYDYYGGTFNGSPTIFYSTFTVGTGIASPLDLTFEGTTELALSDDVLRPNQVIHLKSGTMTAAGFTNDSSVELSSGNLTISSGTLANSNLGTFHVLAGTSSHNIAGNISNAGLVQIDGPIVFATAGAIHNNGGSFVISAGQNVSIISGTFEQNSGTLVVDGSLMLAGGTFRYLGGMISGTPTISDGTLVIQSTAMNPAAFALEGNSTLLLPSNLFGVGSAAILRNTTSSAKTVTSANGFANSGTIVLTGTSNGSESLAVTNGTLLNNVDGLVKFEVGGTGTRIFNGSLINNGTVVINRTTTFNKTNAVYSNYGAFSIATGAAFTLASGATFDQVAGAIDIEGTFTLPSGTLDFLGGSINGTAILQGGTLNIGTASGGSGSFIMENNATLVVASGMLQSGQSIIARGTASNNQALTSTTGFANNGAIHLTSTSSSTGSQMSLSITDGALVNNLAGLLEFQPGGTGSRGFYGNLINYGEVLVDARTVFGRTSATYINSGTITITPAQSLTVSGVPTFEQAGGALNVQGTFLQSTGTFNYTGGTINGTVDLSSVALTIGAGVASPLNFNLAGSCPVTLGDGLLRQGQVLKLGNATLVSTNGFANSGSLRLNSSSINVLDGALINNADGLIHIESGAYNALSGNLQNNGTIFIDASKSLTLSTGARLEQVNGTLDIQGTLKLTGGTFMLSGGEFDSATPVDISSGTIIINTTTTNPVTFAYSGFGTQTLDVKEVGISVGQTHLIRSTSTSTTSVSAPNGFINNGNILFSTTSSGGSWLNVNGSVTNSPLGLIHIQSGGTGTRRFTGDLLNAGGLIQIDAQTTFGKSGAIFQQTAGTTNLNNTLSFSGAAQIDLTGGEMNVNGSIAGVKIVQNGGVVNYTSGVVSGGGGYNYLSGIINGTVPLVGTNLTIGVGIAEPFSFSMARSSTLTVTDGVVRAGQQLQFESDNVPTTITSSSGFTNHGTISLHKSTWSTQTTFSITSGTLTNAPTGIFQFTVPYANQVFSGNLVNYGQLMIESNTSFTRPNSTVTNHGDIVVTTGAVWSMQSSSIAFEQTNGNTLINGTCSSQNPKRFTGGRLLGNGKIASVENISATVEPGDAVGTLTVLASYVQQSAGKLLLEVGGKQKGQFDVLSVIGPATIRGTLEVQLIDLGFGMYSPSAGDTYTILSATGGITGQFENLMLPALTGELVWKTLYSPNELQLVATLAADFNGNGTVDAADYAVWRKSLGSVVPGGTGADGDLDGQVTEADYDVWRSNHGRSVQSILGSTVAEIPEPTCIAIFSIAAVMFGGCQIRTRRG